MANFGSQMGCLIGGNAAPHSNGSNGEAGFLEVDPIEYLQGPRLLMANKGFIHLVACYIRLAWSLRGFEGK